MFYTQRTDEMNQDEDKSPDLVCTSPLQRWHVKKGLGDNISPQPLMEVTILKTKLDETKNWEIVKSLLYEPRINPSLDLQAEMELKKSSSYKHTDGFITND